jgi:hypothetical protein
MTPVIAEPVDLKLREIPTKSRLPRKHRRRLALTGATYLGKNRIGGGRKKKKTDSANLRWQENDIVTKACTLLEMRRTNVSAIAARIANKLEEDGCVSRRTGRGDIELVDDAVLSS